MKTSLSTSINWLRLFSFALIIVGTVSAVVGVRSYQNLQSEAKNLHNDLLVQTDVNRVLDTRQSELDQRRQELESTLASLSAQISALEADDQRVRNTSLQKEITEIKTNFARTLPLYERMVDLKEGRGKGTPADKTFALILADLSKFNYASAGSRLAQLTKDIQTEEAKIAVSGISANVALNNTPPGSGYSRQKVHTDIGDFIVDIVAGDLATTRVIVDTASDSTCGNNCPVLPLGTYVSRSGAFAGINGTYFCPESYPQCAGKTNSFDLLVMNKNKTYFNSDNNVYSQNPVAVFSAGSARFMSKAQDWGRDTGVDGVISNFPLLLINGQNQFGGNSDPKMGSRGSRSFIGSKGNIVYIGVARNVTVAENAVVLKALGLDHAMNLDSGGSTALWASGGYKAGPGRSIPNAVLFVRR